MDKNVLMIGGGIFLLYLLWKNSPAAQAQAAVTNAQTAALVNAQLGLQQTTADVNAGTNLVNTLAQAYDQTQTGY